jgi:hypothetical protein
VAFDEIEIEGMNANDVYTNIIQSGVSQSDAIQFIGSWLLAQTGKARRTFDYATAFPATEPDCVSHFHRSFVHRDWTDGEDLVQAQQSAGEDGFNLRFHRIENDLDALGADVAEAFLCLAQMRSSLRSLLDELKTELNTIEGDLATLKSSGVSVVPVGGTRVGFGGGYVGSTNFLGNYVDVFQDPNGQMILTPGIKITGGTGGPVVDPEERMGRAQGFASFAASNELFRSLFVNNKAVTKDQVLKAVGNVLVDGVPVSDLIDILPSTARFSSPEAFASGLAEREGLALRTSGTGDAAVASALGFAGGIGGSVADASIHDFQVVPGTARTGLAAAGITSVGALAKMTPANVANTLREGGVTGVTPADAAGWIAAAQTLGVIR